MPSAEALAKVGIGPSTPKAYPTRPFTPCPTVHIPVHAPTPDPWGDWPPDWAKWPPDRSAPHAYNDFAERLMRLWRRLCAHRIALGLAPAHPYIDLREPIWLWVPTAVDMAVDAFAEAWNDHGVNGTSGVIYDVDASATEWSTSTYTSTGNPANSRFAYGASASAPAPTTTGHSYYDQVGARRQAPYAYQQAGTTGTYLVANAAGIAHSMWFYDDCSAPDANLKVLRGWWMSSPTGVYAQSFQVQAWDLQLYHNDTKYEVLANYSPVGANVSRSTGWHLLSVTWSGSTWTVSIDGIVVGSGTGLASTGTTLTMRCYQDFWNYGYSWVDGPQIAAALVSRTQSSHALPQVRKFATTRFENGRVSDKSCDELLSWVMGLEQKCYAHLRA